MGWMGVIDRTRKAAGVLEESRWRDLGIDSKNTSMVHVVPVNTVSFRIRDRSIP